MDAGCLHVESGGVVTSDPPIVSLCVESGGAVSKWGYVCRAPGQNTHKKRRERERERERESDIEEGVRKSEGGRRGRKLVNEF